MNGKGQPLDVGRATRTIPDGLRRAVAARDRGCAHPGCGRPPSWCEVHHIVPWEYGGETRLSNLAMLCRVHHRQIHSTDWIVRIRDGLPEFIPPAWIDPEQRPRRVRCHTWLARDRQARDDSAPARRSWRAAADPIRPAERLTPSNSSRSVDRKPTPVAPSTARWSHVRVSSATGTGGCASRRHEQPHRFDQVRRQPEEQLALAEHSRTSAKS